MSLFSKKSCQKKERKIPDEILVDRNKTTSDSLNYAKTSGTMRQAFVREIPYTADTPQIKKEN